MYKQNTFKEKGLKKRIVMNMYLTVLPFFVIVAPRLGALFSLLTFELIHVSNNRQIRSQEESKDYKCSPQSPNICISKLTFKRLQIETRFSGCRCLQEEVTLCV